MTNFKNALTDSKKPAVKGVKAAPKTAAQRIENLEKSVEGIRNMIKIVAEEMDKLQTTRLAIAKRLDATLKVANGGELTEAKVNSFEIEQQVKDMKDKVDLLVSQNVLVEANEITKGTNFVVGQELTNEGEVVSPRTQATIQTLPPEVQKALIGKKVGDLVQFEDGKLSFQVQEIYTIENGETAAPAGA